MQLDGQARTVLKKYIQEQIEEVKTELLYPITEIQTATLRGRYIQLEAMLDVVTAQDKPKQ